jgi:GWxTD domain-containing protein
MSFPRRMTGRLENLREASSCRRASSAASWHYVLFPLLLIACARGLVAQNRDLTAFQDSLQRIEDVTHLRTMLATRGGRSAQSPITLTERGFVALRIWDLTTDRPHSKLAEKSFKAALERDPHYGWAHYGLGLTYVSGPDANPEKAGWRGAFVLDDVVDNLLGNDIRTRAHQEFVKAVSADPPVSRAAEDLAENAVTKNKRKTLEDARAALIEHVTASPSDGSRWIALARVDAELGSLFDAAAAIERAAALGVKDSDVARTRAALLLRIVGREAEGERAWFAGVDALTPATAEDYYNDIEPLLSKQERAAWKQFTLSQRADFLRSFWEFRAGLSGVSTTARLAEHYRRLAYARTEYYRGQKFGAPGGNELRMLPFSQRSEFDDRGLIFVRHGEPDARIGRRSIVNNAIRAQVGSQLLGYESWIYRHLDGSVRSFHFEGSANDYHLMHKLPCDSDWLNDRSVFEPQFSRLAVRCGTTDWLSISAQMRQYAFEALATDTDYPNFTKELPFYFDLYTFRGQQGSTSVVAAVAVPLEKLKDTDNAYRLDVSLIVADTATKRVIRQDDSLSMSARSAPRHNELLRLHVEVAAPPSRSTVQRVIVSDPTEPGIGQLYGGPFPIPDYNGSRLMLSDIVLAEPAVEGRWHRGEVALALVPTGYFKGGSFSVFYEVYNIAPNARYSTELEIEPVRTSAGEKLKGLIGGKSKMTLRFDGVASNVRDGTLQELRRVEAPLAPARYRLRITVKNLETQETAKNERTFVIPKD